MHRLASALAVLAVLAVLAASLAVRAQEEPYVSQRAMDALTHVVAHEIGHAVLREFDLPVIGPEEGIADDFATVYVHMTFPERAAAIVSARADFELADAQGGQGEEGRFSEYRHAEQRAGRMVCVLYGLDPERHADLRDAYGMGEDDAESCRDLGPEVARAWRRLLADYRMPEDARVTEVRLTGDDIPLARLLADSEFAAEARAMLAGIDWHSLVTLSIEDCDGSAGWVRNGRRITLCDAYVERFERQLGG